MFKILQSTFSSVTHPAGPSARTFQWAGRAISTTSSLYAEPLKKRRRLDPAVLKVRVERKIKKVEREILKLESEPSQLAPVLEYQLTNSDISDLEARPQHKMEEFGLTPTTIRAAKRLWTFYRGHQSKIERMSLARVERAQTKALEHMEAIDPELYNATVAVDDTNLIPYRSSHMRKETGANANYTPPDGHMTDITKEWVI